MPDVRGEGADGCTACLQIADCVACTWRVGASTAHQREVSGAFVDEPLRRLQSESAQSPGDEVGGVRTDSSRRVHAQLQLRIADGHAHLADVLDTRHQPESYCDTTGAKH